MTVLLKENNLQILFLGKVVYGVSYKDEKAV